MATQLGPTIEAAEALESQKVPFDYKYAREQGLSDADIADLLAQEQNVDINYLYEQGLTPQDVIEEYTGIKDAPVEAFGQGAIEAAAPSVGMTAGAIKGATMGAPLGPYGVAGGAILGGLTGLVTGSVLNEFFIDDEKQFQNVGAEAAGETLVGAIPLMVAPYTQTLRGPALRTSLFLSEYLKKQGIKPSVSATPIERILSTALVTAPGRFGLYETGAAAGSSVLAGLAEESDPGDVLTRTGAEIAGATVLNPFNIVTKGSGPLKTLVQNVVTKFKPETRQSQLGMKLVNALEQAGENPQELIALLKEINAGETTELEAQARRTGVEVGKLTTAARTGSPTLGLIEAALRKKQRLGPTKNNASLLNLEAAQDVIDILYKMDDPAAMAIAADLQKAAYESAMQLNYNSALANAVDTAGRAFDGSQESAAKAGQVIADVTQAVVKEGRDQEKALYNKIDRKEEASVDNIVSTFDEIKEELLPESPFPALITRFVNRISGRDEGGVAAAFDEDLATVTKVQQAAEAKAARLRKEFDAKVEQTPEVEEILLNNIGAIDEMLANKFQGGEGDLETLIAALARLASDYRATGQGEYAVGRELGAPTRARVASAIETKLKQIQALRDVEEAKFDAMLVNRERGNALYEEQEAGFPGGTLGDLVTFRSEMLRFARDARAAGNFRDANFYGRMAEAALDDIGLKTEVAGGAMPTENQLNLRAAYNFSVAFNDVFTRAFSSDVLGKNKQGAQRLPPELLADKFLGGSANATNLKLVQLQDMAKFLATNAGEEFAETSAAQLETVNGAMETMLRSAAVQFYNPATGKVNQSGLLTWLRNNDQIISKFPTLKEDLSDAASADKLLRDVLDENSRLNQNIDKQLALGAFLQNYETPGAAMGDILGEPGARPKNPVANFEAAARSINQAGADVMEGFKSALMDHAYTFAGGTDGNNFNFAAYRDYFTKPIARGQPSLMFLMRKHKVMSDAEITAFNRLLKETSFIEQNILKADPEELPTEDVPDALYDLVVRVIGARVGTRTAQTVGMPGSIQVPSYFAEMFRNKFVHTPKGYFNDVLAEAAQNPELMELLLRKGVSKQNNNQIMRFNKQLNAALVNAGLATTEDEFNEVDFLPQGFVVRPLAAAEMPSLTELESYLESVTPPPVPQPSPNVRPAPAPVPPSPAPQPATPSGAGTNTRSQYATMFPNDPIANLIKEREAAQSGGIGSLMGPR